MNVGAFILAVLAVIVFLATQSGVGVRLSVSLGLALLTSSWIVQLVWGGADVHVH